MASQVARVFLWSLALLAIPVQGNLQMVKRHALEKRDCDPGETQCGSDGVFVYCARAGWKCCDTQYSAPADATCCANNKYAPFGNYCCTDGDYCPNGKTCRFCTPADGSGGFSGSPVVSSAPVTTSTPRASSRITITAEPETTTVVIQRFQYYTFTITYYYYQYFYTFAAAVSRSTTTSTRVTTTTTVSVYASNSAEAQSSLDDITATASLPTPRTATALSSLPTLSTETDLPSLTVADAGPTINLPSIVPGPPPPGGQSNAPSQRSPYTALAAWTIVAAVGALGFGINFML